MPRTVQFVCCAAVAFCGASFAGDPEGLVRVSPEGVARAEATGRVEVTSFGVWQAAPAGEGLVQLKGITPEPGVVRATKPTTHPLATPRAATQPSTEARRVRVIEFAKRDLAPPPAALGVWSPVVPPASTMTAPPAAASDSTLTPSAATKTASQTASAVATTNAPPVRKIQPSDESQSQITEALHVLSLGRGIAQAQATGESLPAPPAAQPEPLVDTPSLDEVPESGERTLNSRMKQLNRPVNSIALIEPLAPDQHDPENVAKIVQGDLPAIGVWGSPFSVMAPQRYTYAFIHGPLYYQDVNLERCGRGHGVWQPVVSAADFVGRTAILPYLMTVNCPGGCEATLGDCPTCHEYPFGTGLPQPSDELTEIEGVIVEAAVIGGIVALLTI